MAKKVKIDAWQKYQNPLLTQYNIEQLAELKRSNWSGLLLGIDQLYSTMYHEWDALQKDCNDIAAAVRSLEWTVVPKVDDGEEADELAQKVCQVVQDALWQRARVPLGGYSHSFLQLVEAMVHAVFRGFNVHQIEWANDGELVYPARYVQLYPQFLVWETQSGQPDRLLLVPDGSSARGVPFEEGQFIVALNNNGPDHPVYNATFYSLVNWFLAYKFGLAWFMQFTQKYGMPKQVFQYASEKDREQLIRDMEDERVINALFLKGDRKYELVNPPAGGASLPQAVLIQKAEEACHKAILGQTLTSDTSSHGGSLAQAKVHAGVRAELVLHHAEFVAEVLNQQLIPAIVRANFGKTEGVPIPELRCKLPGARQNVEVLNFWKMVMDMGIPFKKSEFHDSTGIAMPGEGDEVYGGEPQGGIPGMPEMAEQEPQEDTEPQSDEGDDDDDPEPPGGGSKGDSVEAARAARRDAAQAWLAPLKERLREARARGASLAEIAKEAREWRLDTVSLAADMAVNVQRGLQGGDEVRAENPYGCNQYGEGWAEPHEGKQTKYEQTGFSGKQSKMLKHSADGNTVSVATKQKHPGKAAYPDASEKGLAKAAEHGPTESEKAVLITKNMLKILEQSEKTFKDFKNEKALAQIKHMREQLSSMLQTLEDGKTPKEKAVAALKNFSKMAAQTLEKLLKNPKPEKSPEVIKMETEHKAKSAELTKALEGGLKEAQEAMAEFEKLGEGFAVMHMKTTINGFNYWIGVLKKNAADEVTPDSMMKLKAHGSMVAKMIKKAKADIAVLMDESGKKKKEKPKPAEKPAEKPKAGGIKQSLLDMPAADSKEVKEVVQAATNTGEKCSAKVWGTLKDTEKSVVYAYSGSHYGKINNSFRIGKPTAEALRLQKVLNKMETGMDLQVTRCEGVTGLENILPEEQKKLLYSTAGLNKLVNWINAQVKDGNDLVRPNKAPMSTSLAKGAFGKKKIVRMIALPKGTKGGCIANYSMFKYESEFLVAPGTKTRIIGAEVDEWGTLFIREEVIK